MATTPKREKRITTAITAKEERAIKRVASELDPPVKPSLLLRDMSVVDVARLYDRILEGDRERRALQATTSRKGKGHDQPTRAAS